MSERIARRWDTTLANASERERGKTSYLHLKKRSLDAARIKETVPEKRDSCEAPQGGDTGRSWWVSFVAGAIPGPRDIYILPRRQVV